MPDEELALATATPLVVLLVVLGCALGALRGRRMAAQRVRLLDVGSGDLVELGQSMAAAKPRPRKGTSVVVIHDDASFTPQRKRHSQANGASERPKGSKPGQQRGGLRGEMTVSGKLEEGGVLAVAADGVQLDDDDDDDDHDNDHDYPAAAGGDGGKENAGDGRVPSAVAPQAHGERPSRFSFLGGRRASGAAEQTPEQLAAAADKKWKADALIEKKRLEKVRQDAAKQLKAMLGQITPKKLDALATDEAEAVLEGADGVLAIATEAKVEWAKIVELRTSITAARERTQERLRDAVREVIREDLVLIDKHAAAHGAKTLIEQIYLKHPPKRRTVTDEEIGRAKTDAHWKKILLKAQRDYHPDRNQGREHVPTHESTGALRYGVLEWQMLSNAICQRLTIKFDKMFKAMDAALD